MLQRGAEVAKKSERLKKSVRALGRLQRPLEFLHFRIGKGPWLSLEFLHSLENGGSPQPAKRGVSRNE